TSAPIPVCWGRGSRSQPGLSLCDMRTGILKGGAQRTGVRPVTVQCCSGIPWPGRGHDHFPLPRAEQQRRRGVASPVVAVPPVHHEDGLHSITPLGISSPVSRGQKRRPISSLRAERYILRNSANEIWFVSTGERVG